MRAENRLFFLSLVLSLVVLVLISNGSMASQSKAQFEKDAQSWFQNGQMHYEKGEYGNALLCFYKSRRLDPSNEAGAMIQKVKEKLESQHANTALRPIPVSEERKISPLKNPNYNYRENGANASIKRVQFFRKNYGFFIFPTATMNLKDGDYFDVSKSGEVLETAGSKIPGRPGEETSGSARSADSSHPAENIAAAGENAETSESAVEDGKKGDEIKEYFVNNEDVPEVFTYEGQIILRKGKRHGKLLALTFDDGPHPTYTQKILKILKANDAKATFFMLGSRINEYKSVAAQVAKEGHEIGNHSYNHPFYKKVSHERIDSEVKRTDDLIKKVTSQKTIKFYRPPYGSLPKYFIKKAENEGFYIVMWSLDSKDYQGGSPDRIIDKMLKYVRGGDVMLFHDIHGNTVQVISELVPILKKAGFKFVTLSEVYGISGQEKPAATAEISLADKVKAIENLYIVKGNSGNDGKTVESAKEGRAVETAKKPEDSDKSGKGKSNKHIGSVK